MDYSYYLEESLKDDSFDAKEFILMFARYATEFRLSDDKILQIRPHQTDLLLKPESYKVVIDPILKQGHCHRLYSLSEVKLSSHEFVLLLSALCGEEDRIVSTRGTHTMLDEYSSFYFYIGTRGRLEGLDQVVDFQDVLQSYKYIPAEQEAVAAVKKFRNLYRKEEEKDAN